MHVHQVEPDNSHQHPLYSLQTQYQLLLTVYFICTHSHTKQVRSNNHITIHHIRCKHNIDLYLHPILCTYTKLSQTSHITIHYIPYKHHINFFLHPIYAHIQSKLGQTSHTSIHRIHWNTHQHLLAILCTCTSKNEQATLASFSFDSNPSLYLLSSWEHYRHCWGYQGRWTRWKSTWGQQQGHRQ